MERRKAASQQTALPLQGKGGESPLIYPYIYIYLFKFVKIFHKYSAGSLPCPQDPGNEGGHCARLKKKKGWSEITGYCTLLFLSSASKELGRENGERCSRLKIPRGGREELSLGSWLPKPSQHMRVPPTKSPQPMTLFTPGTHIGWDKHKKYTAVTFLPWQASFRLYKYSCPRLSSIAGTHKKHVQLQNRIT